MRAALLLLLAVGTASADEPRTEAQRAVRVRNLGISLAVSGLALSLTGGAITIANGGFDRETSAERVRFGLGIGFALGAVPLVTAGITLWANGAIRVQRVQRRP